MSLCPHGIRIEHRRCDRCEQIAEAEHRARVRDFQTDGTKAGAIKLERFGSDVVGIKITGNVKRCEPECVRVDFPGGQVDVTRARDGEDADYWIHVRVYNADDPNRFPGDGLEPAKLTDARLDIYGKHASDSDLGDFADPKLYHLAVRVTRVTKLRHGEP